MGREPCSLTASFWIFSIFQYRWLVSFVRYLTESFHVGMTNSHGTCDSCMPCMLAWWQRFPMCLSPQATFRLGWGLRRSLKHGMGWKTLASNRDLQIFTLSRGLWSSCNLYSWQVEWRVEDSAGPDACAVWWGLLCEQRLSAFTMDNLVRRRCHKFVSHHAQDVWHCPKTNGTQHILRASSHIVDTNTRPLGVPVGCGQVIGYHWYHWLSNGFPMLILIQLLSNI